MLHNDPRKTEAKALEIYSPVALAVEEQRLRQIDGQVRTVATFMDDYYLDPILGLIPGLGDLITTVSKIYIFVQAIRIGLSREALWKIAGWGFIDFMIGSFPIVGDALDFVFKSNVLAADLVTAHVTERLKLIEATRSLALTSEQPAAVAA